MVQSRFVLGGVLFFMGLLSLQSATAASAEVSALKQRLLGLKDHELYLAAITQKKGPDGKMWSKVGACLHNDASQCPTCACTSYSQTNYTNPTGYNGLPYSPTVPGTGCAALHGNAPDQITCWSGWAELGLCPAKNMGLEKLVANQMRLALKNSEVDVCRLQEYLHQFQPKDREMESDQGIKLGERSDSLPVPSKPLALAPSLPVPGVDSLAVDASLPGSSSAPNKKPPRFGLAFVSDQKLPLAKVPQVCGLVFPGPSGSEAFAKLDFKRCLALSGVIKTKGVISSKGSKLQSRTAFLSKKDLMKVDQKCNAGLGRFIEGRAEILLQISRKKPDGDRLKNAMNLLQNSSDRMKDSVRACIDRNLKIDQ
jgi:hypothetical protein